MMFTREELEDIWQTKTHGHFSKLMKDHKGKKKFTVKTVAIKVSRTELDSETIVVYAKSENTAKSIAYNRSAPVIRQRLGSTPWESAVIFSSELVKVK